MKSRKFFLKVHANKLSVTFDTSRTQFYNQFLANLYLYNIPTCVVFVFLYVIKPSETKERCKTNSISKPVYLDVNVLFSL